MAYDSILSERALREIYLMPFMLAQKYAKPWCFMTSYVRISTSGDSPGIQEKHFGSY
jgi:beta-glucosidase